MKRALVWVAVNELEGDGTVLVLDAVRPAGASSQFVRDSENGRHRLFLLEGDDLPAECEVSPGQAEYRSVTVKWRDTTPRFHVAP